MTRFNHGDAGDVYPEWKRAKEEEQKHVSSVWMTCGRTAWGHQITEVVAPADVPAYLKRGWRVYHPDYENSPWSFRVPYWLWRLTDAVRGFRPWTRPPFQPHDWIHDYTKPGRIYCPHCDAERAAVESEKYWHHYDIGKSFPMHLYWDGSRRLTYEEAKGRYPAEVVEPHFPTSNQEPA